MAQPGVPVFLERRTYRQRRLHDAVRILPIAGVVLLLLPLLGQEGGTSNRETSGVGLYIFGIWLGLIVIAAVAARALRRSLPADPRDEQAPDPEG